ncbi:unnamed protein product [Clavelina lepadiformis]|uniref:SKI/SNO/DAC domain-containing protein n=1 Tax=Clavelina lepadiformis TaxID=159417 RepID=A0ABP0FY34_CLALP
MSVMPLVPAMHGKWDSVMTPPQLSSYKIDRPAYSTPPPVENTPSNNECRMVELRGSKVASFTLNHHEYICLPQAFDLFLKHLVGGLHTVYTKLKRLNISPVVCNVEQVRILRGLGAIQPGVNRCKLITKDDFEILYQDCTTASRPGRPPKRYPVLPPSNDMMSHHSSLRGGNTLLNQTDLSAFHKRIRLSQSLDQSHERRASSSPVKENEKNHCGVPGLSTADLHNNTTANLAYLQALRQQYQQAAGLHNGLDAQQINPALAPFMMMSHPGIFSPGIPPTSMAMPLINHINQLAQNHAASGAMTSAAAAAVAQIAASGAPLQSDSAQSSSPTGRRSHSPRIEKDSDAEENHAPRNYGNTIGLSNGVGSDGRTSPASSLGSMHGSGTGHAGEGNDRAHGYENSLQTSLGGKVTDLSKVVNQLAKASKLAPSNDDQIKSLETSTNVSSMQTLLTNIQGLLKVAADNASLQEKHASIEIAELKLKLTQERQLRENFEQKLLEFEKEKVEVERKFSKERKENKKLHGKLLSMQQLIGHDLNNNTQDGDVEMPPSPIALSPAPNSATVSDAQSESSPPPVTGTSPMTSFPVSSSFDAAMLSAKIAAAVQQQSSNQAHSPSPSPTSLPAPSTGNNLNNSNNRLLEEQKSPDYLRRSILSEHRTPELAVDLGVSRTEHSVMQDKQRLFFNNPLLFQQASQQAANGR